MLKLGSSDPAGLWKSEVPDLVLDITQNTKSWPGQKRGGAGTREIILKLWPIWMGAEGVGFQKEFTILCSSVAVQGRAGAGYIHSLQEMLLLVQRWHLDTGLEGQRAQTQ